MACKMLNSLLKYRPTQTGGVPRFEARLTVVDYINRLHVLSNQCRQYFRKSK